MQSSFCKHIKYSSLYHDTTMEQEQYKTKESNQIGHKTDFAR